MSEIQMLDVTIPATTQVVEYGSDLIDWSLVTTPATTSGMVEITPGSPSGHDAGRVLTQGGLISA